MTLTNLIKSAEEKLANPDLTLGTRRREEAILHHLTSMKAETEELKCELHEAYNASNILLEANKYFGDEKRRYLAETEVQQMAISELRAEKQELMDIIGRSELKAVDVMTWEVLHRALTDTLIRHKWPDEKPTTDGEYLARLDTGDEVVYKVLYIVDQYTPWTNYITHWWNLPEVTE